MKRGEIFYIRKGIQDPNSRCIWTGRPAVIVSCNDINTNEHVVMCAFMTTSPKKPSGAHVTFPFKNRMATILCEQISSIDVTQLDDCCGVVPEDVMVELDKAIQYALGTESSGTVETGSETAEFWKNKYIESLATLQEVVSNNERN